MYNEEEYQPNIPYYDQKIQIYNSIQQFPINKISIVHDEYNIRSCYVEPTNIYFTCQQFSYGNKQTRNTYQISKPLKRYFAKRYFYFSLFDGGIKLDEQSWYSVIPEPITKYIMARLNSSGVKSVFQPFCGVGGIAVHFCQNFYPYWVNDIDYQKIGMLKNNMNVYAKGINKLKIINKDFFQIQPQKFDMVIVCPPWGGVDITDYSHRDLDQIMNPKLSQILTHCKKFSNNILLQMPKNTNISNLIKIINYCFISPLIKIQKVYVNQKLSQLLVYLGDIRFTKIHKKIYNQIIHDAFGVKNAINHKQAVKDLIEKIKIEDYSIFQHIYNTKRPNQHIVFNN